MRMYQPIWVTIRDTGQATVMVAKPMHSRLIRAVKKEKCKDLAWRVLNPEYRKYKLFIDDCQNDRVTFTLYNVHAKAKPIIL